MYMDIKLGLSIITLGLSKTGTFSRSRWVQVLGHLPCCLMHVWTQRTNTNYSAVSNSAYPIREACKSSNCDLNFEILLSLDAVSTTYDAFSSSGLTFSRAHFCLTV